MNKKAPWTTMLPPPVAKQRKWLSQVSKKQAAKLKEYNALRKRLLECNPKCGVCFTEAATDCHHRRGRGKWLTNEDWIMMVCRTCHRWIHDNPKEATERGYLLQRI